MHCFLQLRKDVFPPFHDDGGRLVLRENDYLQKRNIFRLCVLRSGKSQELYDKPLKWR